jgi:hypothetical protein
MLSNIYKVFQASFCHRIQGKRDAIKLISQALSPGGLKPFLTVHLKYIHQKINL